MHRLLPAALVAVSFLVLPTSSAVASELDAEARAWTPSAGVRIGGYGFRHAADDSLEWNDCRMNGVGALVRFDRQTPWYLQVSLDGYHATGETVDAGMDRLSLLPVGAIGARLQNRTPLLPHIELGLGAELTHVELGQAEATRVLPTAYIGLGLEIVAGRFAFGTTLRANAMGLPEHEHAAAEATKHDLADTGATAYGDAESDEVTFRTEVAGQATFSLRYSF